MIAGAYLSDDESVNIVPELYQGDNCLYHMHCLRQTLETGAKPAAAGFSGDGRLAVTLRQDGTANVYDGATGAKIRTFTGLETGYVAHLKFSTDGKTFIVNHQIRCDVTTGEVSSADKEDSVALTGALNPLKAFNSSRTLFAETGSLK
jgi:WD40 repeat protein